LGGASEARKYLARHLRTARCREQPAEGERRQLLSERVLAVSDARPDPAGSGSSGIGCLNRARKSGSSGVGSLNREIRSGPFTPCRNVLRSADPVDLSPSESAFAI